MPFPGWTQLVTMLCGVFSCCDSMCEICWIFFGKMAANALLLKDVCKGRINFEGASLGIYILKVFEEKGNHIQTSKVVIRK